MKKILTVLKINVLSIFAIFFLLIATLMKLIGKAVERFLALLALFAAYLLIRYFAKADLFPKTTSGWAICGLIAVAALVGLFFLFRWLTSQLSSTLVPLGNGIISFFDSLYEIIYNKYLHFHAICENDYKYLAQNKSGANAGICLFYTILRGVSWLVITLVSLSLPIAIAGCVSIIVITLFKLNARVRSNFGMSLTQFLKKFDSASATSGVLSYLFMVFLLCMILLVLAFVWHEWAKEIRISSDKVAKDIQDLTTNYLPVANQATTNSGKGSEYVRKIQSHVATLSTLGEQVQPVLSKTDNALLRSYWGNYMRNLTAVTKGCFSDKALPYEKLKTYIPRIKLLDRKKKDVQKLLAKLGVDLKQPTAGSTPIFFADCDTEKKLEEQYKLLYKAYHPSSPSGNADTFKKMQAEYERAKEKFQKKA